MKRTGSEVSLNKDDDYWADLAVPSVEKIPLKRRPNVPNAYHRLDEELPSGAVPESLDNPNPTLPLARSSPPDEQAAEVESDDSKITPETTIHTWVIFAATEQGGRINTCRLLAVLCVSPLFLLVQFSIMNMIIIESSYARCMVNDNCRVGEWCAPPLRLPPHPPSSEYPGSAGECQDCSFSDMQDADNYSIPPPTDPVWTKEMIDWYHTGKQHCDATDTMPHRCDHLVHNLDRLSGGVFLVLIFCIAVILYNTVEDMNQAHVETAIVLRRTGRLFETSWLKGMLIKRLCSITMLVRIFITPIYLVETALALILAGSMTSQGIMLNSLAVTIMSKTDDICWYFFVPPQAASRISQVFADEYRSLVAEESKGTGFTRGNPVPDEGEKKGQDQISSSSAAADLENQVNAMSPGSGVVSPINAVKVFGLPGFTHSSRRVQTPRLSTWVLIRMWAVLIGVDVIVQLLDTEYWMYGNKECSSIYNALLTGAEQFALPALMIFEVCRHVENIFVLKSKSKGKSVSGRCDIICRECIGLIVDLSTDLLALVLLFSTSNDITSLHLTVIVRGFGYSPLTYIPLWPIYELFL